ncbi:MAG TPA: IS200/IS605 family transposase [Chryseosolibacter sp.]
MSFVRILVHVVWGTKYREPILVKDKREILFNHIRENAKSKSIHLLAIGGYEEHVHCLISLSSDQTIARTVQLLKGESSNWANKRKLFSVKLIWADDYFAASVSNRSVFQVRNYILHQERHHEKQLFDHEFNDFKGTHGFD